MAGFTAKQIDFLHNANHRWNIKSGATRSGKTYLDYYVIPKRIRRVAGKDGLTVLLGNTKGTLQRNIIEPLQNIWGTQLVSDIRSDNTAMLFGERCYCLGADKVSQVDKIRGSSIKYCYGDEVVTWHNEVFEMLKSRLDKEYSRFDGTCNPGNPNHWFKAFMDSDADIFRQDYTIYDNTYLPEVVVKNLEKEYRGTVYFDRYILGKWVPAEGIIYKQFADNTDMFLIDSAADNLQVVSIGIDYGASRSKTTFKAVGFSNGFRDVFALAECDIEGIHEPEALYKEFERFYFSVVSKYNKCQYVFADYGALGQILTAGLFRYCQTKGIPVNIDDCSKGKIFDRIEMTCRLMAQGRLKIMRNCKNLIAAFQNAVWDEKHDDTRLDDGSSDIDSLDAFEYATYPFYNDLMQRG